MPPDNLRLARFAFVPASLPGLSRFWAVYERLDRGEVSHFRYLGLLPQVEGEAEADLTIRARGLLPAPGEN